MGLLNKLFRKNDKIKVKFIDNSSGTIFGVSEMAADQLPETFSINTTMHLRDVDWTVEEAIPENSMDFIKSKSLILKLRKTEQIPASDFLFTLSSISNEFPNIEENSLFNDFEISITEDEWQQSQFLNKSSFPLIDIEIAKIHDVIENYSTEFGDSMKAFTKCHVRDTIGEPNLKIDLLELQKILDTKRIGSLKVINNPGFILNGFSLLTNSSTFYGVVQNEIVTQLGISEFSDFTGDEIENITKAFGIIFIDWNHCDIITEDD